MSSSLQRKNNLVGLESHKKIGYRKMLQAANVAIEVGDEADMVIIAG